MPPILTFLVVAGLLGAIGYAAWILSRDAAAPKPKPDPPYERALGALLNGDRDEAIRALLETVHQESDNVDAYIHLGNLLREKGEAERAYRIHRELTARAGHTPSRARLIREGLILDLIALGRPAEAVEEARQLRDAERKSGHSLRVILKAHEAAGEWEKAYEIRSEMLRQNGDRAPGALARYRASIGEIALRNGALEDAKRHFKSALKLERDQPVALLRLGDIYYETGHAERAILLWKGLASAHPEHIHLVLERLEVSAFDRGRFSEMEQTYEELLSHNPKDVRVRLALARLHMKRGDLEEAARALRSALDVAPHSAAARLLLVQVHRQRGNIESALDEVEAALRGLGDGAITACGRCGRPFEEYWSRCPHCLSWIPLPAA